MKLSLDWLSDFVEWKVKDPQEIARLLTAHVAEVDAVVEQGALLENCCIGKVLSIAKHPDADRLSVCEVKTDKGTKKVVCGGTNLREGMKVLMAHVGARVKWHGTEMVTLEKTKIRGIESEGMICAAEELGLENLFPTSPEQGDRPIADLGAGDDGVGQPARKYLGLNDVTIDIDNHAITHRPDLFSQIGFAREVAAMGIAKAKKMKSGKTPKFAKESMSIKIKNDAGKLIPRYCACTISISDVGETPDWMKRRLEATGWRSLNLPIDITNYVSTELGMPLHSFDLDDLKGNVHMRTAKEGEKITTLDKVERKLPAGAIVLSDDEGIFDLLGIMGGLRSSTKNSTRHILLHSAIVDPVSIRKAIIATGHRTEASTVYEKSIPLVTAELGFYRALELFLELVPGATITSKIDTWGDNGKAPTIKLSTDRVTQVLGVTIPEKTIKSILTDLGFSVSGSKGTLTVKPPLWRLKDVTGDHDLIEEIGRIYGYNKIQEVMPLADATPPARDHRLGGVRDALQEQGYLEIVPLSFVSPDLLNKCSIDPGTAPEVQNALGVEFSLMQPSTLPHLLEHAEEYLRHADGDLQTCTISHVFTKKDEHNELGLLYAAQRKTDLKHDPFLLAKQHVMRALGDAGHVVTLEPAKQAPSYAHPGRTADLLVGKTIVGQLFEVHPAVRVAFGLPDRASAALIDLTTLLAQAPQTTYAKPLPQFPAITYDVTIPMAQNRAVHDLLKKVQGQSSLLESVEIADLYAGAAAGITYNLTLRLTYRSPEKTLTEAEVKMEHEKVLTVLS